MTLILTAATDDVAMSVADTRLTTEDGKLFDDKTIKTLIVHCQDAKVAISYTGLAHVDRKSVDAWLAARLTQASQPVMTFHELVTFCSNQLTAAVTRTPALGRVGLTLVFTGLGIPTTGKRSSTIAIVTNCKEMDNKPRRINDVNPQARAFNPSFMSVNVPYYLGMFGAVDETGPLNSYRKQIVKQLEAAKTANQAKRVLDLLVDVVRKMRLGRCSGVISEQCVAVAIASDFSSQTHFYGAIGSLRKPPIIVKKSSAS